MTLMSTVEEHFAELQKMMPYEGGWLTDQFHLRAASFLGAHINELEAAWKTANSPKVEVTEAMVERGREASPIVLVERKIGKPWARTLNADEVRAILTAALK